MDSPDGPAGKPDGFRVKGIPVALPASTLCRVEAAAGFTGVIADVRGPSLILVIDGKGVAVTFGSRADAAGLVSTLAVLGLSLAPDERAPKSESASDMAALRFGEMVAAGHA